MFYNEVPTQTDSVTNIQEKKSIKVTGGRGVLNTAKKSHFQIFTKNYVVHLFVRKKV